jgi:hypothetical protein
LNGGYTQSKNTIYKMKRWRMLLLKSTLLQGGCMNQRVLLLGFSLVVVLLLGFLSSLPGDQAIIAPDIDVYIVTFGGGEGLNTFIKYDISSVPSGMVIDSVFLRAYVWEVSGTWDGDVMFCNVNNQAWTEADSSRYIINLPLSDSILHTSGFGTSIGFTQSVDIADVFLADYNASNTFCTIKLKDPDDPTFNPMPGSYPVNSIDTLGSGNPVAGFHIYFYPSEYPSAPPWLMVHYHATGVQESPRDIPSAGMYAYPNPFTATTTVYLPRMGHGAECTELSIFDVAGRRVRDFILYPSSFILPAKLKWDGRDNAGQRVVPGIYYLFADGRSSIRVVKLR